MTDTDLIARLRKEERHPSVTIRTAGVLKEAADALEHAEGLLRIMRNDMPKYVSQLEATVEMLTTTWDEEGKRADRAEARVAELEQNVIRREARRLEILDWLQEDIGTAWKCDCGWETYHATGNECAECGEPFPFDNMLAFKLHASGTDNEEYIERARVALKEPSDG